MSSVLHAAGVELPLARRCVEGNFFKEFWAESNIHFEQMQLLRKKDVILTPETTCNTMYSNETRKGRSFVQFNGHAMFLWATMRPINYQYIGC